MQRFAFLSVVAVFLLAGCIKDESFPNEPAIEFNQYIRYGNDSAEFVINFTDGDGDLGLSSKDTNSPFHQGGNYHFNLRLKYLYLDTATGQWVPFVTNFPNNGDLLEWNFRFPRVLKKDNSKAVKGEIHSRMYAPYYVPGHTKYRFECFIYDRALNKSNVITSPPFTP
jgi:hypothetical protein